MIDHLGSGMNRILKKYPRSSFYISENFLEVSFPFEKAYLNTMNRTMGVTGQVSEQVGEQVGEQVRLALLSLSNAPKSKQELLSSMKLSNAYLNYKRHVVPLLEDSLIEMTIPEKPNSRLQKIPVNSKRTDTQKTAREK